MPTIGRWALPGYSAGLALAVTAPLFTPGYLLLRDAVSTPRSYLSDAALGLGEAAPRAVPQDFAVAVLSSVLDGGIVVKALLVTALVLAGWGAGSLARHLVPESGLPGRLIAATIAIWNPYVAERLLQGHWSLLLGYGCLPWVAAAAIRLRTAPVPADWGALAFWTALAGLTPTGLILAAVVALVCVAVPGEGVSRVRCAAAAGAVAVLAGAPWLMASALGDGLRSAQSEGVAAFAARAEPGLGTVGALAGLGGIWNAEAVPPSRTTLVALAATAVLLTVVALGIPSVYRRPAARPLLVLAAVSVVLPAAAATAPGLAALEALVEAVPGLGVLRDAQKWVALAMPGYALAGAGTVLTLRRLARPAITATVCCLALILALPDLAWGVAGRVGSVRYPAGWPAVSAMVDADPRTVAVLPADMVRRFGWAGPAPVLDPLPRWVRAEVLATGDLRAAGQTVTGEGRRARAAQRLLLAGAEPATLVAAGVGWLVVESGTPGDRGDSDRTLQQLDRVYSDADIALYRVGGDTPGAPPAARIAAVVAHLVWVAVLVIGAIRALRRPARRGAPTPGPHA